MEHSIKQWKILVSTINIQLDLVYFMEHSIKQWKILVSTINIQLVDLVSFMENPMKYFASSDPHHGIQFIPFDNLSGISIWHSICHVF